MCSIQAVRWTKSAALAGLDSYSAAGFDSMDVLEDIAQNDSIPLPIKSELTTGIKVKNEKQQIMKFLKRIL